MDGPGSPIDGQNISDVLRSVSAHLDHLCEQTQAIEQVIGQQLCPGAPMEGETIKQLQSMDYLRQSLEDLTLFTGLLSNLENMGTVAPSGAANISSQLTLSTTKALICSSIRVAEVGGIGPVAGELDLL